MTQAAIRIKRQVEGTEQIKRLIALSGRTGLCAVCHTFPVYAIRPGVNSMTCGRMQCRRAWLLGEPWCCQFCRSMDFERLEMQWDSEGRKLYRCYGSCKKTYAIHHRMTFETMAEAEAPTETEEEEREGV